MVVVGAVEEEAEIVDFAPASDDVGVLLRARAGGRYASASPAGRYDHPSPLRNKAPCQSAHVACQPNQAALHRRATHGAGAGALLFAGGGVVGMPLPCLPQRSSWLYLPPYKRRSLVAACSMLLVLHAAGDRGRCSSSTGRCYISLRAPGAGMVGVLEAWADPWCPKRYCHGRAGWSAVPCRRSRQSLYVSPSWPAAWLSCIIVASFTRRRGRHRVTTPTGLQGSGQQRDLQGEAREGNPAACAPGMTAAWRRRTRRPCLVAAAQMHCMHPSACCASRCHANTCTRALGAAATESWLSCRRDVVMTMMMLWRVLRAALALIGLLCTRAL